MSPPPIDRSFFPFGRPLGTVRVSGCLAVGNANGGCPDPKGTRSVSTLTPSQLARKRANDREAQRAIRARTKEHIERLERELEELKSRHSRDETVQDLLKRNKALERELMALRESLGIQGRQYPNQGQWRTLGRARACRRGMPAVDWTTSR